MVCGSDIFLSAIDIPATMFHLSMAVFLFYSIVKSSKHFCTGFYVLFTTIFLFDVIQICMIYIALRIPSCGYFPTLYLNNHWLVWLMYISTTYIELYQLFGHTLISINRFALFVLPLKYNWIWSRKALYGWPFLNAILPLPLMAIRFRGYTQGEAGYVQLSDGTFTLALMQVNKIDESITVGVIATAMIIATLTAYVLDLLVIIKIKHHLRLYKQSSISLQNDIKLLFSSIVVFGAQLLVTFYYVAVSYSVLSENDDMQMYAQRQYIWICDVISLCGSFALFAISDTVRRNYLKFYGIRTNPPTMVQKFRNINHSSLF